jgi:hypothetical protein
MRSSDPAEDSGEGGLSFAFLISMFVSSGSCPEAIEDRESSAASFDGVGKGALSTNFTSALGLA